MLGSVLNWNMAPFISVYSADWNEFHLNLYK